MNVYSSIAITIFNSLTYFLLYKLIIAVLGIDAMGLWAIVLGFTSIISQAAASINTNIIREVASYDDESYSKKASDLIINGLIIYFIFFCILTLIVLASFRLLFHNNINNYISIIPLMLISIFINLLGLILSSVLDARRLNYIKNIILSVSNLLFISFCFYAIKQWGLIGVAIAQIFQAFVFLVCIFFYVTRKMKIRLLLKDISKDKVSSFLKESWKLQGISLLVLCYEPITKYFLSKFGFSYVAKYEIANKILTQMRNIFAVSNQTLLSVFVNKLADGKKAFISYYYFILNKNLHWAFIATGVCLLLSPLVSLFFF